MELIVWLEEQACSRVLGLGVKATFLRGKGFCFYCMFETNFSGREKI